MSLNNDLRRKVFSIYTIFIIVASGLVGFFIFESVVDENGSAVAAKIIIVDINGTGNYTKIQDAINAAIPGDTIRVWAGTYNERIFINKSITLIGNSSLNTTIKGSGSGNVFLINGKDVNVSNFTFTNSGHDSAGLILAGSENCHIYNNRFLNNYYGIELDFSKNITLSNNSMLLCGLSIRGQLLNWNTHNIDNKNFVNSKPLYYWNNKIGGKIPSGAGQVVLANCSNVIIENQNTSDKSGGIILAFSSFNIVKNNTCNSNIYHGIYLWQSSNNLMINNTCTNNKVDIYIDKSNNNTIINNTCSSMSGSGIILWYSSNNSIINNTSFKNIRSIYLWYSQNNTILNIMCNSSSDKGFILGYSSNNTIINNTCINSGLGIALFESLNNTLQNNNYSKNNYGIRLERSSNNNSLVKNMCNSNQYNGISVSSSYNILINNYVSNNLVRGIYIPYPSNNNYIYLNNIINNTNQAQCGPNNHWNNSLQEGNYWSNYTGVDDGSGTGKHSLAGDGIGDTKLPHLGLDNYPFIDKYGWLKPGIPILTDPGVIDLDGNYTISWNLTVRTTGFILEEGNSPSFDSPIRIYNGSKISFNVSGKQNETFYYRLKAYNEKFESSWSNIVDIIVDWLADIPKNLSASIYPSGNTINLTWKKNIVDTKEYLLEFKNETIVTWQQLEPVLHPNSTYNHTGLVNGERYYYRIQARDHHNGLSKFSKIIYAIPRDSVPPNPPNNLIIIKNGGKYIHLTWTGSISSDVQGYEIFINDTGSSINYHYLTTTMSPNFNHTNVQEETIYYYKVRAFDEVPLYSTFSNIVSVTTLDTTKPNYINGSGNIKTTTGEEFILYAIFQDNVEVELVKIFYTSSTSWQEKTLLSLVIGNYSTTNINLSIDTTYNTTPWIYYFYAEDTSGNFVYYGSEEDPFIITVIDNDNPVADAGEDDRDAKWGAPVIFDASGSTDNIEIINYTWTFKYLDNEIILYGKITEFIFENSGEYAIQLTVFDAVGNFAEDSFTLHVWGYPPDELYLVSPKDRSIHAGPIVKLSWFVSSYKPCILKCDVYLGTNPNPPLYKANVTAMELEVPIFEELVDYYWNVKLSDSCTPDGMSETQSFRVSNAVPAFGLELTANLTSVFIEVGQSKSIQLIVKNTQDRYSDEFALEFDKDNFPGEVELSQESLIVSAGGEGNLFLNLTSTDVIGNFQIKIMGRSKGALEYNMDINQSLIILIIVQNTSQPELDSDNDNLPDAWEERWFGDIALYDGFDDPDSDGKTNYREYFNNTDPTTPDTELNGKKPKEPEEEDNTSLIIAMILVPIITIILILLLFIFLKKKKGGGTQPEIKKQEPGDMENKPTEPTSIQQQPQFPNQNQQQNDFLDYNTQEQNIKFKEIP